MSETGTVVPKVKSSKGAQKSKDRKKSKAPVYKRSFRAGIIRILEDASAKTNRVITTNKKGAMMMEICLRRFLDKIRANCFALIEHHGGVRSSTINEPLVQAAIALSMGKSSIEDNDTLINNVLLNATNIAKRKTLSDKLKRAEEGVEAVVGDKAKKAETEEEAKTDGGDKAKKAEEAEAVSAPPTDNE